MDICSNFVSSAINKCVEQIPSPYSRNPNAVTVKGYQQDRQI
jgi:hypothetical protein